jgi:hypothetical protein
MMTGGSSLFQIQWMGTGVAGLPGAHAMLLIRDQEPESVLTLPPNREGDIVRASSGKRRTAHFQ